MKQTYILENRMDIATTKSGALFLKTPPLTGPIQLTARFTCSAGPIIPSILEDYSFVGGATLPAVNINRNIGKTSAVIVKGLADASAVAGAAALTLVTRHVVGSSTDPQKLSQEPISLKPDTNYLLVFPNSNAGTVTVSYMLSWKE